MECFALLVVFIVMASIISGIGLGLGPHRQGRAYQLLTRRFGGVFQGGGIFRRPCLRFPYGRTWITITPSSRRGRQSATQALVHWPDAKLDLKLESRSPMVTSPLGTTVPEVRVTDADFNSHYQISGPYADDVRRFLSDGVQWQIARLDQLLGNSGIRITVRHGRMVVEKPVSIRRAEDLEEFTQLALELFDQAMLTRSEGIEFLEHADDLQPIEDPICQICGEPILTDMIFCRRCRTPHHLDCWIYNGACSTYGCRETRYAFPSLARPVEDQKKNSDTSDRADRQT